MSWLAKLETKDLQIITDDGFIPADAGHRRLYNATPTDMLTANVVMTPVNWVLRNFTEAEAVLEVRRGDVWKRDDDHVFVERLRKPNPYYGDSLLWKATVLSFMLDGNAYWQKVRNVFGDVLGYWYLPHFLVEPRWTLGSAVFITHYEYRPLQGAPPVNLRVEDVVHFRDGLDPYNPRKGMSRLKPLLREVFTDEEASTFSAAILGNMGVPGGVISPANKDALPSVEDVAAMKAYMKNFTGQRRGEWMVLGSPTNIAQFGFDPNNLMLGNLRDIAEERVCAAIGVPVAVVGFGSGLQTTKVGATMRELRKEAWNSCIRPTQTELAKQGSAQMLPDFVTQLRRYRVWFDTSDFAASQEEESERTDRVNKLVAGGVLRVDRAQQMLGLEVDPAQAVYLRPSGVVAVAPDDAALEADKPEPEPAIPSAIAARLNGGRNGTTSDEGD